MRTLLNVSWKFPRNWLGWIFRHPIIYSSIVTVTEIPPPLWWLVTTRTNIATAVMYNVLSGLSGR